MATLAKDRKPPTDIGDAGIDLSFDITASDTIYRGAMVSVNASGNAYPTPGDSNGEVVGIATEQCANETGAAGAKQIKVRTQGVFAHALSGATKANIGAKVYASDDNALSLTSTNNDKVGWIVAVPASGTVHVKHHWPGDLD